MICQKYFAKKYKYDKIETNLEIISFWNMIELKKSPEKNLTDINAELQQFNERLLKALPNLAWENPVWDLARAISSILWLDRDFDPSSLVSALGSKRQEFKALNNPDFQNKIDKNRA